MTFNRGVERDILSPHFLLQEMSKLVNDATYGSEDFLGKSYWRFESFSLDMKQGVVKKYNQLGMSPGKASHILKKSILFAMLKEAGKNYCFQCGSEIENAEDLTIEHKVPWLDSEDPVKTFFDLENIAFSHNSCNSKAARRPEFRHGTVSYYRKMKCRCDLCKQAFKDSYTQYRRRE